MTSQAGGGERRRGQDVRDAAAADFAQTGERDATVEIVPYDPTWPAKFEAERARLQTLLPADAAIHHIGSTAVPGLAAKPVIDVMALVADVDEPTAALTAAGYQFPQAFNATLSNRRWLCRPSAAHRTHHLHLVSDRAELDRHLRFRDRLRASAALRKEYAALKRQLAERHRDDREAYSDAKTTFVRRVEADTEHRL